MGSTYNSDTVDVEKDVEVNDEVYYYEARVSIAVKYTEATHDDPAEEDVRSDVDIEEVRKYDDDGTMSKPYDVMNLPKKLKEAIEEDAEEYAYNNMGGE